MQHKLLEILRCPATRTKLTLKVVKETNKSFDKEDISIVEEGILFAEKDWYYPVIKGIPRLCVESFLDHDEFLKYNLKDHEMMKANLLSKYGDFVDQVIKKNKRTKESFSMEWSVYDYEKDRTWNADDESMLTRFLTETDERMDTIQGKIIFDAGCGNGKLNCLLATKGIENVAMDFSSGIEVASHHNRSPNVYFIQGDVQFPPVCFNYFDIVHSSGVLIHTNNTELSFSCLAPTVKNNGKLSVWLYHPRKNFTHNLLNAIRNISSKLPLQLQYYLYKLSIFPISYCLKRLKGNRQNKREMMVDILDWFTPQYRWEHQHNEVAAWFYKRDFTTVKITTDEMWGFNTVAIKK